MMRIPSVPIKIRLIAPERVLALDNAKQELVLRAAPSTVTQSAAKRWWKLSLQGDRTLVAAIFMAWRIKDDTAEKIHHYEIVACLATTFELAIVGNFLLTDQCVEGFRFTIALVSLTPRRKGFDETTDQLWRPRRSNCVRARGRILGIHIAVFWIVSILDCSMEYMRKT